MPPVPRSLFGHRFLGGWGGNLGCWCVPGPGSPLRLIPVVHERKRSLALYLAARVGKFGSEHSGVDFLFFTIPYGWVL